MLRLPVDLQGLVDIYDQPFLIIDADHRVVVANRAFTTTFRAQGATPRGTLCHRLMASLQDPRPCGSQGHTCPFEDTFAHQVARTSAYCYRDATGQEYVVRTQAHPLRAEDGTVYVGVLMQRDEPRNQPLGNDGAPPSSGMVGDAPAFRKMLDRLLTAAGSEAPVLLQGETGTGKELAADFIHRHSARHAGPFQTIDCSVLTGQLFESEVFGHERGAFTGNVGEKRGLFELADGGTLFLDEIGEMPLALQAKLLRVLESGEFRRLGGIKNRRVNVRLICASNRELLGAPEFRSDLYYRVACLSIRLPGLRERASDIPLLTAELLERIGRSAGRRYSIDPSALQLLLDHDFPGNVRELRNVLWVAAVNAPDGCIGPAQVAAALPAPFQGIYLERGREKAQVAPAAQQETPRGLSLRHLWDPDNLALVLRRHHGNRRAVSRELGVSERTLYRKLRQFGLN